MKESALGLPLPLLVPRAQDQPWPRLPAGAPAAVWPLVHAGVPSPAQRGAQRPCASICKARKGIRAVGQCFADFTGGAKQLRGRSTLSMLFCALFLVVTWPVSSSACHLPHVLRENEVGLGAAGGDARGDRVAGRAVCQAGDVLVPPGDGRFLQGGERARSGESKCEWGSVRAGQCPCGL